MNDKLKIACKISGFVMLSFLLFYILSNCMISTDLTATTSLKGFYHEEDNTIDALVIGASEVYTSYSPTMAWEQQGFTSYCLAGPGVSGNLYKYMLAEVLKTQKPKVVAFEVNGFIHGEKYFYREANIHNILDNMKWSDNRVQAIENLVPEEDKMSYYFPIEIYHNRWAHPRDAFFNTLIKGMFLVKRHNYLKGVSTYSYEHPIEKRQFEGKYHYTDKANEVLHDLMQYCKDQGIEHVLFFYAPHGVKKRHKEFLRDIFADIEAFGYDTLDCNEWIESRENHMLHERHYAMDPKDVNLKEDICLREDFYNNEHVNVFGMEKNTRNMAAYFVKEYGLKDEVSHEDILINQWNEDARQADKLFKQCKEDIREGRLRRYLESSNYVKSPVLTDYMEYLGIDYKEDQKIKEKLKNKSY